MFIKNNYTKDSWNKKQGYQTNILLLSETREIFFFFKNGTK